MWNLLKKTRVVANSRSTFLVHIGVTVPFWDKSSSQILWQWEDEKAMVGGILLFEHADSVSERLSFLGQSLDVHLSILDRMYFDQ